MDVCRATLFMLDAQYINQDVDNVKRAWGFQIEKY